MNDDITYQKVGNFEIHRFPSGTMIQVYVIHKHGLLDYHEQSFRWAQAFVETPQIFTEVTTKEDDSAYIRILTKSDRTSCYYYEYGALSPEEEQQYIAAVEKIAEFEQQRQGEKANAPQAPAEPQQAQTEPMM